MANINFTKVNGIYEAEMTATGIFNLHIVTPENALLCIYVKDNDSTNYVLYAQTKEGIHRDIVAEVWNKKFRFTCDKQPIEATYRFKA